MMNPQSESLMDSDYARSLHDDLSNGIGLPASWYHGSEIADVELDRVFGSAWQYAGHTSRIENTGDYFTTKVGKMPVVVTRGNDGNIHAFANVCRHRYHEVAQGEGNCKVFVCPYHAWSYNLDGTLRAAPRQNNEENFDPGSIRLLPLPVELFGPLIFVAPTEQPPIAFLDQIAPLPEMIETWGIDLSSLKFANKTEHAMATNWKVYIDNVLECYHCPQAHKQLCEMLNASPDVYKLEAHKYTSIQTSEMTEKYKPILGSRNPKIPDFTFAYVWPNLMINFAERELNVAWLEPSGPSSCTMHMENYDSGDLEPEYIEANEIFGTKTYDEDIALVESVQRGLESGKITRGRFMKNSEHLAIHFNRLLIDELSRPR